MVSRLGDVYLYPHDAEEVLKIRLSERNYEDYIAWHYEKSGLFTVKSAYHLALQLEQGDRRQEGLVTEQMEAGCCIRRFGQPKFHQRCVFSHGSCRKRA
jgi:hypothetical protein